MSEIKKFSDLKYTELPKSQTRVTDEKLKEVSDMYEKHFIKEMMKSMRSTVAESGLIKKNNAEKIFQDQLDDQYSEGWNKRGGFGLSDMIYEQLQNKFGSDSLNNGFQNRIEKPQGPIDFKKDSKIENLISPTGAQFKFFPDSEENLVSVNSPWAGELLNKSIIDGDKSSYRIKHDNGLESLILIQGAATEETRHLSPGDAISAGQSLGSAVSTSPLFWTVKKSVS